MSIDAKALVKEIVRDLRLNRPGRIRIAVSTEEYRALAIYFADKFVAKIMTHPLIVEDPH